MTRNPLPHRRPNIIDDAHHGGLDFTLCMGFNPDTGKPKDVFVDGPKEGSDMQALLSDICVVISLCLQNGVSPRDMAHSLGTVPKWTPNGMADGPASVVGTIMETLIYMDETKTIEFPS